MRTLQKLGFAALGVVVAGLLVWGINELVDKFRSGNEDRPPILVKRGSVHFNLCSDSNGKKKVWKQRADKRWRVDHSKGIDAKAFLVVLSAKSPTDCTVDDADVLAVCVATKKLDVVLSDTGGNKKAKFSFRRDPTEGSSSDYEPTLSDNGFKLEDSDHSLLYDADSSYQLSVDVDGIGSGPCNAAKPEAIYIKPIAR